MRCFDAPMLKMASGVRRADDNNDVILHPHSSSATSQPTDLVPPGDYDVEQLTINRLPGEPLGMRCDVIDGDVTCFGKPRVMVRRVVQGSPAERATGGNHGVEVGDEILAINGIKLTSVSRVELLQFLDETPLTLILLIRRQAAGLELEATGDVPSDGRNVGRYSVVTGYALQTCKPSVIHDGFEVRQITFEKLSADKLGLQLQRRSLGIQVVLLGLNFSSSYSVFYSSSA